MELLYLALATAAFSTTVAKSHAFEPMRVWLENRLTGWPTVAKLVRCPYCVSHWVALVLALVCQPQLVAGGIAVNVIVATFATIAAAAIITGLILKLLLMHESEVERLRTQLNEASTIIQELLKDEKH